MSFNSNTIKILSVCTRLSFQNFVMDACTDPSEYSSLIRIVRWEVPTFSSGCLWTKMRGIIGWGKGVVHLALPPKHRGVHLILANNWPKPAILAAGKGRERMSLLLLFLYFHSFSFFSPVHFFHLLSPFLWETTQKWPTRVDVSLRIICRLTKLGGVIFHLYTSS